MSWLETISGVRWDISLPQERLVRAYDIAHALGNLCRFAGHCRFYSVAEHSVNVSRIVTPEHALHALLHDASEAYLADLPSPVKSLVRGYKELEDRTQAVIYSAFGLRADTPWEVHQADLAMLLHERDRLNPHPRQHGWPQPLIKFDVSGVEIVGLPPELARRAFIARLHELQDLA